MFKETPEAQAIIAWHDSQTEEFLASLPGYEDGLTPRQAWEAFCSLPATKQPGEGLAAPADAGQGAVMRGAPPEPEAKGRQMHRDNGNR